MLKIYFHVKIYRFLHYLKSVRKYYKKIPFAFCDLVFHFFYFFQNPYKICRKYNKKMGRDLHQYGETTLITFDQMIQSVDLGPKDTFIELGAGRGICSIWLAFFYPCKVIAVEQIPHFVFIIKLLKKIFFLNNLEVLKQDFTKIDLSQASVIYLYGTCMKEEEILCLLKNLDSLNKGTKIITISFPLTEFVKNKFVIRKKISTSFAWGTTSAYIQEKM